jgi:hypothetical protein
MMVQDVEDHPEDVVAQDLSHAVVAEHSPADAHNHADAHNPATETNNKPAASPTDWGFVNPVVEWDADKLLPMEVNSSNNALDHDHKAAFA